MSNHDPHAAMARWSVARFEGAQRVLDILSRTPLPDRGLAQWADETLSWADEALAALACAQAQANEPPPQSLQSLGPIDEVLSACARALELYGAFVETMRNAADDIVTGRASEINLRARKSLSNIPWLVLESTRLRFAAGAAATSPGAVSHWLLLARAHAYAVRRDLEEVEEQATAGVWFDGGALLSNLAELADSAARGRALTDANLVEPAALAEHERAADILRSYKASFETLTALAASWGGLLPDLDASSPNDRIIAIEDACTAFSYADAEIDRHLSDRGEIIGAIGREP